MRSLMTSDMQPRITERDSNLDLTSFFERGESVDLKPRVGLSLALPRTNKRLKMFSPGNPQDEDEDEEGGAAPAVDEDEDLEVALAYTPVQTISTNFSQVSNSVALRLTGGLDHGGGVMPKEKYGVLALRNSSGGVPTMAFESISTLDFERDVAKNFFTAPPSEGSGIRTKKTIVIR